LREIDDKLDRILQRQEHGPCRFSDTNDAVIARLITGIGTAERSRALRHLNEFLQEIHHLTICDRFFLPTIAQQSAQSYVNAIDSILPPTLKAIEIFRGRKRGPEVASKMNDMFKRRGIRVESYVTDEIHDRVWIANHSRAYAVGTSPSAHPCSAGGGRGAVGGETPPLRRASSHDACWRADFSVSKLRDMTERGLSKTRPQRYATALLHRLQFVETLYFIRAGMICSITASGFDRPPAQKSSQMPLIWLLVSASMQVPRVPARVFKRFWHHARFRRPVGQKTKARPNPVAMGEFAVPREKVPSGGELFPCCRITGNSA
jgi:hypothetical protein